MRKKLFIFVFTIGMVLLVSACSKEESNENVSENESIKTEETTETEYEKVEIKQASEVNQMSKPEKGETIAIVKVKGFGELKFKFFQQDSPLAVENFVTLAYNHYYDGITFHRVINDFMIQGGDPTGTGMGGESIWGSEFENETSDVLLPLRGALCMANAGRDTNGSQFFVVQNKTVTEDTYGGKTATDEQKKMFDEYGGYPYLMDDYTVFGQLYEGYDVLDDIAATEKDENDKPVEDVVIESITIKEAK
ncbi:MAG: peptidylprolyl isomerase [Lachnospiraceae bacterium]|nr:peptidylprolyl isomerase [Lachnospiraceae bacterium]